MNINFSILLMINLAFQTHFLKKKNNNLIAPFYGWGSTALRLEPIQGGSLPFTNKSPEIPVVILSTSEGRMAQSTLESPSGF